MILIMERIKIVGETSLVREKTARIGRASTVLGCERCEPVLAIIW